MHEVTTSDIHRTHDNIPSLPSLTLILLASASEDIRMSSSAMVAPMDTTTDSHTTHPVGL